MKKLITATTLLIFCCGSMTINAQTISEQTITQMRNDFKKDPSTLAIRNILTTNGDIRALALNRDMEGKIDHLFKYRVNVNGITDQKNSGRCWMFTSLNVLRPSVNDKYNTNNFAFSHSYLYFWDILEKSNLFLQNIITTADKDINDREIAFYFSAPVSDGGVWNCYYNAAAKYGVVPTSAMPETKHSENTAQMMSLINEKLRADGYRLREAAAKGGKKQTKALEAQKTETLSDIYRILALCLGEPAVDFTWRYKDCDGKITEKQYTPLEFYKEITPADYSPENYIMIMNDPTREYYKLYEISNYRNTYEGVNWLYLNLPNEDIKRAALASIKNNEAMYASCDVNKYLNRTTGIMDPALYDYESLLGVNINMDKKARILTRQSGSSHAMTLIGVDTDKDDNPMKWEFENSWGTTYGNDGYLTFTDKWFDEYMFRLVIHRKYLDAKSISALNQKPIILPAWDYMY